jgi:hypothetical protein
VIIVLGIFVMQILGIHPAFMIAALLGLALMSRTKKKEERVDAP